MAVDPKLAEVLDERSLLGLFLERAKIDEIVAQFPPQSFEAGEIIFSEGQTATHLGIMITGKGHLTSFGHDGNKIVLGDLTPHRSANLYAVVRGAAFQYSVVAAEKSDVLLIPWAILEPYYMAKSGMKQYLELITGMPIARQIRREIDDLNCNRDFRTEFMGYLVHKNLPPESWIARQGDNSPTPFFLIDGTAQVFQKATSRTMGSLWAIPRGSWQLWADCLDGLDLKYSYRSLLNVSIFTIEKSHLEQLRAKYPADFAKYDQWVRRSLNKPEEEEEDTGADINLADLFPKLEKGRGKRKRYPVTIQNDMMDCGAACLASICAYYGKTTSIQFWRERIFTNSEGTSLFDIAKATERNGFVSHGLHVSDINEIDTSYLPCIALRNYHYVVVYEIRKDKLIVGDPAAGLVEWTHEKFQEGFENVVLVLKPNAEFFNLPETKQGVAHYLGLFQGLNKEMFFIIASSVLVVLFTMFPPFLSQIIIDEVLSKKDTRLLAVVLGGAFVAILCQSLSGLLREYYLYFLTSKFDFRAGSSFLRKLFSLPYGFFSNRHIGDFTRRLNELERLRYFFSNVLVGTFLDLCVLGMYSIVLFLYSAPVAIAGLLGAPITVLIARFFSFKMRSAYSNIFSKASKQDSLLFDFLKGAGTIKILNGEVGARWQYEQSLVDTLKERQKFGVLAAFVGALTDAWAQWLKFGLMGFAAYWGIKGDVSPGQIIAMSLFVGQLVDPFKNIAHNWSALQEIKSVLSRLDDVFLTTSEERQSRKGVVKNRLFGEIEFQNVWFRYGGDSSDWVLKGCSFKIKPGQHVAIVGPSGSGKSTVASLLMRLYEPTQGAIFIDGRDYREYDVNWLRSQIGLLEQEPVLFHGSIEANIGFGTPRTAIKDVVEAAKLADAHDFITSKNREYEYEINYSGLGLSGGQKQRLALARLIFRNPALIVLDEATSMLDGISEVNLLRNVYSKFRDRTILSIAHRYSTARASDFALVMENGRVTEFGTHENLEVEDGLYAQLFGFKVKRAA